ncbi:MAG TPA: flagellar basal body P-ring formation chaperone FlgA [Stellaceae bacterium]|nr:flagellar basal body P-ring formation chaperone FlgA [Stellaceae bacterium]
MAADIENPATIRAAIAAAVKPHLGTGNATVAIGTIDSRLRLPLCRGLDVSLNAASGAMMTAKVDCPSPGWTIYVPVQVHAWVDAVVAAANLGPHTRLTAALLTRRRVDLFAAEGALVTDPAQVEGKLLQVGVMAGAPIVASFLENPVVIRTGQRVLLTLTDGGMVIRDSVIALENGRVGDTIPMRNPQSQKVIQATVAGDGTAEIRF